MLHLAFVVLIVLPKLYKLGKSDQLWDKHQQDETRQISNPPEACKNMKSISLI